MHDPTRRALTAATIAALAAALPAPGALAQETWPARSIRLVIPYPPGGTTDIVGRNLAGEIPIVVGFPVVCRSLAGRAGG